MNSEPPKSNVPEFSVTDLAFSLKRTLEDNFGRVRVRGELSRLTIAGSGHMYSSLKDDGAVIDAVCWKGNLAKLSVRPEEGLEVICIGKISSYPKSSKYQLVIESMEMAGEGALLKMLEDRKKKLAAEGLFEESRKKPLPFLPKTIGVVTSPTGAVIRDILHRLDDRMPSHVLVWPVLVQGDGAATQITNAINGFNAIERGAEIPRPDLLIVARGGGSLEDLMAFNEEDVVRAAANCSIPMISAVGHETDTTLIDFVSDLRAPTPTGAAEKAVPVRADLRAQIGEYGGRIESGINRIITQNKQKLELQNSRLGDPQNLLDIKTQNLDRLSDKITHSYTHYISAKQRKLITTSAKIQSPAAIAKQAQNTLNRWDEQLKSAGKTITRDAQKTLKHAGKMLEAYSFQNTLERGFAVIRTAEGKAVTDAEAARTQHALNIQFKHNEIVEVSVGNSNTPPPSTTPKPTTKPQPKKKKTPAKSANTDQQSLF